MNNTLPEIFELYDALSKKLLQLRKNSSFDNDDGRKDIYGILRNQILWLQVTLHIMHAENIRMLEPSQVFKDVFGIGYEHTKWWKEDFQIQVKDSFMTMYNFMLENFFKILLSELDTSKNPSFGYYKILENVITLSNIPDGKKKLYAIYTLALHRNALHNNGFHYPTSKEFDHIIIEIRDIQFEFKKGKETEMNFSQMAVLLDKIIDILDEIISSPKVQQLISVSKYFNPKI